MGENFLEFHSWVGGLEASGAAIFIGSGQTSKELMGKSQSEGYFEIKHNQLINGWGTQVAVGYEVSTFTYFKMTDRSQGHHYNSKTHDKLCMGGLSIEPNN